MKKLLYTLIILYTLAGTLTQAQNRTYIDQDPKITELLSEKRKINSSITLNDRYKIQIFYGTSDECKKTIANFKRSFKDIDGTIIYSNPTYKVLVGNFKTRIEAEKTYNDIKKKYPTALLIRPKKED